MNGTMYILSAITILIFVGFFATLLIASAYDMWHSRKYKTWIALKTDYTKPKRPAAK